MNVSRNTPSKRVYLKSISKRKATVSSLPNEIVLRIFSHLAPSELLSAACVCRRWLELSKDNMIWRRVYSRYVRKNTDLPDEAPTSYWRDQCIKCGIEKRNKKIFHLLKKQNQYTKLPTNVQTCITKADIRWQLTLVDTDDEEFTFRHNDLFHFQTSLTVRWYSLSFPPLNRVKKLKLHSLSPVFYVKDSLAYTNSPCQRSLLLETDVRWSHLKSKDGDVNSGPIKCHVIEDCLLVAIWKDGGELAFVSASLHHNKLVEKCLLGSSDKRYDVHDHQTYRDDIDTKFGLHGYSCITELRNQRSSLWTDGFSDLFTNQPPASGVVLTLIDPDDRVYHQIIGKPLNLPWKTDVFKGVVSDCCILDVTLIDEQGQLIWCLSVPVVVRRREDAKTDFEFDGDVYFIKHSSETGDVSMRMTKDPSTKEYSITSFRIKLATKTINDWFGTSY